MTRLLERVPPSTVLLACGAGVGTFIGGLQFSFYFVLGAGICAAGLYLDHYGVGWSREHRR